MSIHSLLNPGSEYDNKNNINHSFNNSNNINNNSVNNVNNNNNNNNFDYSHSNNNFNNNGHDIIIQVKLLRQIVINQTLLIMVILCQLQAKLRFITKRISHQCQSFNPLHQSLI